ncbi:hypothetical protein Clacol_007676 [Clathrus columnatus]|uniref:Uncharacterized protein n=1 Tax=Clathrus columnatus TaxID=1419009 RepID=A0AAV5AIB1_9AGAM|nr:hypothetical protein Clacol_007676 [Clathrus columnatus]
MSIRDSASVTYKTVGSIPPKLVAWVNVSLQGASTTVAGDCMYLFGGKADSQETFHMYIFNLTTQTWSNIPQPDGPTPSPRYLHSTDLWNGYLVVFGGRVINNRNETPYVLDDIWFFSIIESRWILSSDSATSRPLPRYGHLSSISVDMLYIIGGQDKSDNWVDNIHIYDLNTRNWVHRCYIPYHCGTYRGLAASSNLRVINPSEDGYGPSIRFKPDTEPTVIPSTTPDSFVELTSSIPSTKEKPSEIHMYLNYDFTDLRRELRSFKPNNDPKSRFTLDDRTSDMYANLASSSSFPPALRFATGGIIGSHLVFSGIYITARYTISAWALDLRTLIWTKIDVPTILSTGSWARSVTWVSSNKLVVFGSCKGDLKDDYQNRLLRWDDAVYIDLEAYGIYQPPSQAMSNMARMIGLAALEDGAFADFEVVCDDGRKIPCSRDLLERRWNWFHEERKKWDAVVSSTTSESSPVPPLEVSQARFSIPRPDPRLTPRKLHLPEQYPIVVAFLQYLYTQSLMTPLQQAPAVLSALMLLAATYEIPHLMDLVTHAMHGALSRGRSKFASGIFDVASLVQRSGLRLRAFAIGRRPPVTLPTPPLESVKLREGSSDQGHSHPQSCQLNHQNHHKNCSQYTGSKPDKNDWDGDELLPSKRSHNYDRYGTTPNSVPAAGESATSGTIGIHSHGENVGSSIRRKQQEYSAYENLVTTGIATSDSGHGNYVPSPQSRLSRDDFHKVERIESSSNQQQPSPLIIDIILPVDSSSTPVSLEEDISGTAAIPRSQLDITISDRQREEMQLSELRYIVSETLRGVATGPYWRIEGSMRSNRKHEMGLGLSCINNVAPSISPSAQCRDDANSDSTSSACSHGSTGSDRKLDVFPSLGFGFGFEPNLSLGPISEERGETRDKGKGKEVIRDEDGPTPHPYPSPISMPAAGSATCLSFIPAKDESSSTSTPQLNGAHSGTFYHSSRQPVLLPTGVTNPNLASGSNINRSKTAQVAQNQLSNPTQRLSLRPAPGTVLTYGPLNSSSSPIKGSLSRETPAPRPLPHFPLTPPLTEVGRSISASPTPPSKSEKDLSARVDNERTITDPLVPRALAQDHFLLCLVKIEQVRASTQGL